MSKSLFKYILTAMMGFLFFIVRAQEETKLLPNQQLQFKIDNDAFAFTTHDRYYTNGLFLNYSRKITTKGRMWIGLSHQIYTPDTITRGRVVRFDRPYAGLAYLEAGYQFVEKKYLIELQFVKGKVGPSTRAAEFQKWYHHRLGFPEPRGWEFQIRDHHLTNFSVKAMKSVLSFGKFEFLGESRAAFGNLEKSLSLSPSFRFGKFNKLDNSQLAGYRTGAKLQKELFLRSGANFFRVAGNATLQGGGTLPEQHYFAMDPEKRINEYFTELFWAPSNFAFNYKIFYRSRETRNARGQLIGSLCLSYLF